MIFQNRFSWFNQWLYGTSVSQISTHTKKSRLTILCTIYWYLDHPPKPNPTSNVSCHLAIDGTWFKKNYCLIVYWDYGFKKVQWWHYTTSENKDVITDNLKSLRRKGINLVSVTSDGGTGIKSAVNTVYPDIPHQRCMVHLQRSTLSLITRNPRTKAGVEIRPLVRIISQINTEERKDKWIEAFDIWCTRWEDFLKERSYKKDSKQWWYTHKSLRRVRSLIKNALPNMFFYLEDNKIRKNTNGLEGRFGSLKQHYRQHRGLSKKRREAYLAWYISVVINKELPTSGDN